MDIAVNNRPELRQLLTDKKWDELKGLVHSMKPHFDFMGMKQTRELADKIEVQLLGKKELENLPLEINELIKNIDQSIEELRT